jgi:hypothetical protein
MASFKSMANMATIRNDDARNDRSYSSEARMPMSSHFWKAATAAAVLVLPLSTRAQTYDELKAMVDGPWHHVPNPVSPLQFNRDAAQCRVVSAQTPINSTTPAVVERVRWTVLINCLKANGYEPGAAPATTAVSRDKLSKLGSVRFDDYSCAEIARLRKTSPGAEAFFFTWALGFMSGWNASAEKPVLKVDPAIMKSDAQLKFIRAFCEANPSKLYLEAVGELMAKLKYEKTKATGNPEN